MLNGIAMASGMRMITTTLGTSDLVQYRFPRSKSKRIKKKWRKDQKNFRIVYKNFIIKDPWSGLETVVVHPAIEQRIREVSEKESMTTYSPIVSPIKQESNAFKARFDFMPIMPRGHSIVGIHCGA